MAAAAAAGDADARAELVEAFRPGIAGVARHYRSAPHVSREELMQEGVVGLLRALERFDSELGTPFWAYASWWVRQAMRLARAAPRRARGIASAACSSAEQGPC
jgi:RNA polymerase primary sigma factor